jgi:16S rRNA processing protein RimM
MPEWGSMVLVGRVARPHGLRGHVVVNPETDFVDDRFQTGARLWSRVAGGERVLTVGDARLHGRRPVLAFDGYDSVEAAETLTGAELRIPETELQPLASGTYYLHDLVGCRVESVGGGVIGIVARVDGGAEAAVLAVDAPNGEVLVPLAREICVGIDTAARLIRVAMPEGLLELNETRSATRATEAPARRAGRSRSRAKPPTVAP